MRMRVLITQLHGDEKGATIIEYALVAALMIILGLTAFKALEPATATTIHNVTGDLDAINGNSVGIH